MVVRTHIPVQNVPNLVVLPYKVPFRALGYTAVLQVAATRCTCMYYVLCTLYLVPCTVYNVHRTSTTMEEIVHSSTMYKYIVLPVCTSYKGTGICTRTVLRYMYIVHSTCT